MKTILLGCIADDFTGATDLANNLVRAGMRVVQAIGVPDGDVEGDADAVVVALKSRTIASAAAVAQALAALHWLRARGARQIYFKYCSTFDSTPRGNIGPVTEALMDALADVPGADFTIATPAFPDNQRTVFKGYLFVGDAAAAGKRDAQPPADADDRLQPRARAAGAVPPARGPDRLRGRRAGPASDRGADGGAARGRRGHCRRRRGVQRRSAAPRPGACRPAARDRRLGRGDRPPGQFRPCPFECRERLAGGGRRPGDRVGQLLAGDAAAGAAFHRPRRRGIRRRSRGDRRRP